MAIARGRMAGRHVWLACRVCDAEDGLNISQQSPGIQPLWRHNLTDHLKGAAEQQCQVGNLWIGGQLAHNMP